MKKFKNKYRIPSVRLPYWDYGWNASYFVTICTKNRKHFFGSITIDTPNVDTPNLGVSTGCISTKKMVLSKIGKFALKYWMEIPHHFPFVKLGAFVVMPDHVHGIIIIDKPYDGSNVWTPNLVVPNFCDPTSNSIFKYKTNNKTKKWKSGTLGVIINQYKRICTKHARTINPDFAWQSRYYDHIIRDEKAYNNIAKYIRNNPLKWQIGKP